MNRVIMKVLVLVSLFGLAACEQDEKHYTIAVDEENYSVLVVAGDIYNYLGLLAQEDIPVNNTEDCNNSVGTKETTVIQTKNSYEVTYTYTQCEVSGEEITGVIKTIMTPNGDGMNYESSGGFTILNKYGFTLVEYSEIDVKVIMPDQESLEFEVKADVSIVSDHYTGSFGVYLMESIKDDVFVLAIIGAEKTRYSLENIDGEYKCKLNNEIFSCYAS